MSYITDTKGGQFSLFQTDTNAGDITMVGQRFATNDGREVVLAQAGAASLASGVLVQNAALVANHQNIAVTAYAAASVSAGTPATATATLGATAATLNQYSGGFAIVNAGTGIGQTLQIAGNTAAALSTACTFTFADAPLVALDTSSKLCIIPAPYTGLVINPTTPTNSFAGVTLYPIAAASYGFIVARGIASCLNDGGTTIGLGIAPSASVAGAAATVAATTNQIGFAAQTGVTTESRAVYVNL